MTISRRSFLAYSATGVLTLYAVNPLTGTPTAIAAIAGGTLDVDSLAKFTSDVIIPGVMPRHSVVKQRGGKNTDYYEIAVRQFSQQVLPTGHPSTTVWGYGPVAGLADGSAGFGAPSLTIETTQGVPTRIKWINQLVDDRGDFLPHLLPVDPTLHWCNPEREPDAEGRARTDTRPAFQGRSYVTPPDYTDPATQYTTYVGPVPLVTHLHGAVAVGDESDGYPEAWYLPAARNLPDGIARHGAWYEFFADKSVTVRGAAWGAGSQVAQYPNENRASTLWYHDHALGMTRLNVYAGPAGFYLGRDGEGGDGLIIDSRSGDKAKLPGPAPRSSDRNARQIRYHEVPLAIQDRSFNEDGSLFYPDTRAFFDEFEGPWYPETDVSPVWNPEFFGNTIIVNGQVWPRHRVVNRRYRYRLLNGCQSRTLVLDFRAIPGVQVHQIGNDGGLLPAVVDIMAAGGLVQLSNAERADVIVDFANVPAGAYVLGNVGPDAPFSGDLSEPADPATTGQVIQFVVETAPGADPSTPAKFLVLPPIPPLPAPVRTRRLALMEHMSTVTDGPVAAALGVTMGDPTTGVVPHAKMWMDQVTENPSPGETELWEIYNFTADAHPVHVHEVAFELTSRQDIRIGSGEPPEGEHEGMTDPAILEPGSVPLMPQPGERGRKDTVVAYPDQVTRLTIRFTTPGQYVWHCHIVEHEDNEMMRPYRIGPVQPGQPDLG